MPLQKSFSEQNRPAPKRPQWQRSRSNPNAQAQAQAQAAKAASRPLAPVSESTKNKLLAFQFEPPSPEAGDDPVAVAPKLRNGAGDPAKEGGNNIKKKGLAPGKTSPRRLGRPDPAVTPGPGPRLTWQDLLGVQELPKEDGAASPSERIIWRTDHGAQLPPAMSPMLARKGRKRARSSSPASSPASKSATPAIDAKKLANVLRTSRADPASELWDRFALPGTDVSPSGATNPLLAQLMVSSSPRPSRDGAAPGSTRSLRKAMSCGSHWPKRRKTVRNEEQGAASQGSPRRNAKSSLVSALLETVDGQIQRSKSAEAAAQQPKSPSSRKRSLLGRWTGPKTQNVVSPSRPTSRGELLDHRAPVLDIEANGIDDHQPAAVADSPSSDYGDIDFDDDTLMELDATLVVAEDDNQDNTLVPVPAHESAGSVTADDDFGDLDDNLFDGAEDLVAEVEFKHFSQATSQGQKHDRPQQIDRGMSKDSYGDDFGDDFGEDFDFEAAEMAATQSAVHAPTSSSRVRTFR
ncbi:hypothetical protein B0T24DRAFT_80116 [Lasiosphaeria ovina]|uniref:Uncharacterized protein n=1 Tax=Lasiosphaeria ovina TaxID=92902 RepID=A0AAE0NMT1_9PEZI|nr:hypothetical protein B0T24DRAFT_80116 [Lasiosphaeria ovina]